MIDHDRQAAVLTMFGQGVSRKAIARQLHIDIKTVRAILTSRAVRHPAQHHDRITIDPQLLTRLYNDCKGYIRRVHEILIEEHHVDIGYSTLCRLVHQQRLGITEPTPACHLPDVPGQEMQHDTSVYQITIAGINQKMVCSSLYLRYSKMRYIQFYRIFNRFTMKCFLDEALRHWGFTAATCIIDNTNLAVIAGSGSAAVMSPEMVAFATNYGFTWKAHAINHANRKAGVERTFYTVETNFLPGRIFQSVEDLNQQAFFWATDRLAHRPSARTGLIPLELFAAEKSVLIKLPDVMTAPYQLHTRIIDEYGYFSFAANFYWLPKARPSTKIELLQYSHHLCTMENGAVRARYDIAADGLKNAIIPPQGETVPTRFVPKNRKVGCQKEEAHLRQQSQPWPDYLDRLRTAHRPAFIRGLYTMLLQLGPTLMAQTLTRALAYEVFEIAALRRIACHILSTEQFLLPQPEVISDEYTNRRTYQEGQFCDEQPTNLIFPEDTDGKNDRNVPDLS